ncbi:MAG TPA: formate dehydrogenase accessory protein FdhE [Thermoanaerobaculia bacterium]|nr:formate dehydrogenase accessory protein FdhE [Thermoanaerobaculia bacterium]
MSGGGAFDARAGRAELLASAHSAAAEPLRFAAALFRLQGRLASALVARHRQVPLTGRLGGDALRFVDLGGKLYAFAEGHGPPELTAEARARRADDPETARSRLLLYWSGGRETAGDYLSRALPRPYVETLSRLGIVPDRFHREGHCPFCGGRPIVSLLRSDPASHGAGRWLACGLCGTEWPFSRVRCPSCGEQKPDRLPSFGSEAHPLARLEACDACRRYVKSIDLTADARPIPEVDDLASIAMDLWAIGQGYERIEPGWAGI